MIRNLADRMYATTDSSSPSINLPSNRRPTTVGKLARVAFAWFALAAVGACAEPAESVVAADGTGNFKTLQEAVDAVGKSQAQFMVIRLKPGIYKEKVMIPKSSVAILLKGTDAAKTVITYHDDANALDASGNKLGTFRTPSVEIEADDFAAENITFENSFGQGSQALAISVSGDRAVFRKCRFLGWQDTMLLKSGRQYFEDCYIAGHVDFIFGGASAFFNRCEIHSLAGGYLTAASTPEDHAFGFVFSNCRITAEPGDWKTWLGRPWRPFGAVTFLNTEMPANIRPEGWHNWGDPEKEKTSRYVEFGSRGPGASDSTRVPWAKTLTPAEAAALTPAQVLSGWDPDRALSPERIAALPKDRAAWMQYLQKSRQLREADKATLENEVKTNNLPEPLRAPRGDDFKLENRPPPSWFAIEATKALTETVISFQTPAGGWSKHVSYKQGPRKPGMYWSSDNDPWHYTSTFDNRATTEQLRLLAGVYNASKAEVDKKAFLKGLNFILSAQYPNGGWPQVYPLEGGYHDGVTFNDNAMVHILELLRDIASRQPEFQFVDEATRNRAAVSLKAGVQCILNAQVIQNGKPTVWCAQHEPLALKPAAARLKEPASLSGGESVEILRFLMEEPRPTPELVRAIEAGIAWFEKTKITGLRKSKEGGKTVYVQNAEATDPLWARFYDVETNRPMFTGSEDGIVYDTFNAMAEKNRVGYDYYTGRPKDLTKWQEKWRKTLGK